MADRPTGQRHLDHLGRDLTGELDAVLHLLDRQIIDVNGRMVGKVDDLALDSGLRVTALLTGTPALLGRLGGSLGGRVLRGWQMVGIEQADRNAAYRVDLSSVDRLDSAVHLRVSRDRLLHREVGPSLRLSQLLELAVEGEGVHRGSGVLDVRLDELRVRSYVVGPGRPGGLLGYDRRADQGPWVVARVVRWLHRHAGVAPRDRAEADLEAGTLRVTGRLEPLLR